MISSILPYVKEKLTFQKVLRFTFWRGVWVSNHAKATLRFFKNHLTSTRRVFRNYFLLYLRSLSRMKFYLIQLLVINLLRRARNERVLGSTRTKKNEENLISIATFNSLRFRDFFEFMKQRYLFANRDDSGKRWDVISKENQTPFPPSGLSSANLIFHVHYLEIALEMIDYLVKAGIVFSNAIITCTDECMRYTLENAAEKIVKNRLEVIYVENSYRDARPFLIAVHRLRESLPILKIHTKKSPHLPEQAGIAWRQSLLQELAPDSLRVSEFISLLRAEDKSMVICPKRWLAEKKHWGRNDFHVYTICRALSINMRPKAPFPMGSMFWANEHLIEQIRKIPIPGLQDPRELGWADSTWAHGFERAIGQIVANHGKGIALP
jgi:hypothetical protein